MVDAITAANSDAPAGGCTAGSGADTLVLPAGSIHTLTAVPNNSYGAGLPIVASAITIAGNRSTITRDPGAPPFDILAVASNGNLTLRDTTVSGGAGSGGIRNSGTLTLTNSTVSGNSAAGDGGGIRNSGTLTMTDSTVSGNTAGGFGGGGSVFSYGGTVKLTNSTVSGNTAGDRGGGVFNGGGQGGHSALFLIQTLVSSNSAFVAAEALGPEVFNSGQTGHVVIADNFNLFGHDGLAGVVGFTPGPKDNVSSGPLAAILNPVLGDNGGLTLTHALVAGSPAVDGIPAASCATPIDQRGIVRPQDGDQLLRKPKRCPVERAGIDEGARADPIRRRRYQHPGG